MLARSGGLVCRKIKLKNFYDPKTAGGCGVVRFLSVEHFFCLAVPPSAPRYRCDLFYLRLCVTEDMNDSERGWLCVVRYPQGDKMELSPARDNRHKKSPLSRAWDWMMLLANYGGYFPFSMSAFAPEFRMAPALVGVPVLLCVWLAFCSASSFTTSSVPASAVLR